MAKDLFKFTIDREIGTAAITYLVCWSQRTVTARPNKQPNTGNRLSTKEH